MKGKMAHYLMQAGCDAMTCDYIARSKPCGNSSSINLPSKKSSLLITDLYNSSSLLQCKPHISLLAGKDAS